MNKETQGMQTFCETQKTIKTVRTKEKGMAF